MQMFNNFKILLDFIQLSGVQQAFLQTLTDIVIATSRERQVNTLLYTDHDNESSTFESAIDLHFSEILRSLSIELERPILYFDASAPIESYKETFNAELLTIAKLNQRAELDERLLTTLWKRLRLNTQSRLILVFDDSASELYVTRILRKCLKNDAMHVIALQPSMAAIERSYWTVRIFPTQLIIKTKFPTNYSNIFSNQLKNMRGQALRVDVTNGMYPQFYNYTSSDGNVTTSGYLGRALAEYAYRRNATIVYLTYYVEERNSTSTSYEATSIDFNVSDSTDIASMLPIQLNGRNLNFSVLFDYTTLCLMVPLEQPLHISTYYSNIIYKSVLILLTVSAILISCLLAVISRWQHHQHHEKILGYFDNLNVLQGLFGTPFCVRQSVCVVPKIIYFTISLAGIIIGTAYNAYLQSFRVDAPIPATTKTIDDILNRNVKILISKYFTSWLGDMPTFRRYVKKFTPISSLPELFLLRDAFDIRYAFFVNEMWSIYEEQQKYFTRPLFRLTDICIFNNLPAMLPLHENSLHWECLALFLVRLQEAGLIAQWQRHTFVEMLAMDRITLEDRNKQFGYVPMQLEDLRVIFMTMGVLITLSIVCFVLELFWVKSQKLYI